MTEPTPPDATTNSLFSSPQPGSSITPSEWPTKIQKIAVITPIITNFQGQFEEYSSTQEQFFGHSDDQGFDSETQNPRTSPYNQPGHQDLHQGRRGALLLL